MSIVFDLTFAGSPCGTVDANEPPGVAVAYTVEIAAGQPATIGAERMTIEVRRIRDDRCPTEPGPNGEYVACAWQGHAAVTLRVAVGADEAREVVVGTPAPAHMNLPYEATLGPYRFRLIGLVPGSRPFVGRPLEEYRMTIRVTRR
ncbi:MAG TPA: hypothetical protein VNK91_00180 [Burkholderiaceae bacterium]|nr:hypothetical protein [Burkholderiaceae bacterium]